MSRYLLDIKLVKTITDKLQAIVDKPSGEATGTGTNNSILQSILTRLSGLLTVNVTQSEIMQPVDIQSHYQQTVQAFTSSMVAPSSSTNGVWIDTAGFDQIAVTLLNDSANVGVYANVAWSNDGISNQGIDYLVVPQTAYQRKTGIVPTKARYAMINLVNTDAAPHTVSVWAFLKA